MEGKPIKVETRFELNLSHDELVLIRDGLDRGVGMCDIGTSPDRRIATLLHAINKLLREEEP